MAVVSPMALASLPDPDQDPSDFDPAAETPSASVDFGSPETLAQIRSLTDEGAMTRLLHECIAYQRSLDVRLESLLALHPDLDRHLLSLHRSSHLLDLTRSEAGLLIFSVRSTADLADQVNRKVRELDLAQSRVDAIVKHSHCQDSACRALNAEDFESAARFFQTFLQIDSCFRDSANDHRDQLLDCKRQVESIVHRRSRWHVMTTKRRQIFGLSDARWRRWRQAGRRGGSPGTGMCGLCCSGLDSVMRCRRSRWSGRTRGRISCASASPRILRSDGLSRCCWVTPLLLTPEVLTTPIPCCFLLFQARLAPNVATLYVLLQGAYSISPCGYHRGLPRRPPALLLHWSL